MIKVGVDIVSINRIYKVYQKHHLYFLKRFLSPQEILLTQHKIQTIAGFWAAKEACSKAIGTGIGKEIGFLDIKITKDIKNAPLIDIESNKKNTLKLQNFSISITHESDFAIAVVIAYAT